MCYFSIALGKNNLSSCFLYNFAATITTFFLTMKKLLTLASVLVAIAGISQTIPNAGLENWQTETQTPTHFLVPTHWVTNDELINSISASYTGVSTVQTGITHSGSYAALMQTAINSNDTVNGSIYCCDSLSWLLADVFGGNYALGFPDAVRSANLQGYYKFTGAGSDSALIGVILTKWNNVTHTRDTLVMTRYEIGANASSYTMFNFPLIYLINSEYPDTAFVDAGITGPHGKRSHVGTTFYLDDLSFNGTVALGVNEVADAHGTVRIYPNPFSTNATLLIGDKVNVDNASVEICNVLGQTVNTISNINSHNVSIEKGHLQSGVYFYRLLDKQGNLLNTGKFIVE